MLTGETLPRLEVLPLPHLSKKRRRDPLVISQKKTQCRSEKRSPPCPLQDLPPAQAGNARRMSHAAPAGGCPARRHTGNMQLTFEYFRDPANGIPLQCPDDMLRNQVNTLRAAMLYDTDQVGRLTFQQLSAIVPPGMALALEPYCNPGQRTPPPHTTLSFSRPVVHQPITSMGHYRLQDRPMHRSDSDRRHPPQNYGQQRWFLPTREHSYAHITN